MLTPRVLHVLDSCGAGGIETTFLNVLRVWQREPTWAEHDLLAFDGGALELAFRQVTRRVTVSSDRRVVQRALTDSYQLVHFLFSRSAFEWLPWMVGAVDSAVLYGKGYDMAGTARSSDGLRWQPDESLMWASDGMTFTTDALAAQYTAPAARSTVLGKAADIARFLTIPEVSSSTPARIVCVANLHALKRLGDLVRAFAVVRQTRPDARLRFVGENRCGEQGRLVRLAQTLGVAASCEWVGLRADVAEDLGQATVFALPSGREGVPTAVIEAMAAARPVVVTDVGHVRTVVLDGANGYIVPVGDTDALARRLGELLDDRAHAATMGRHGRERATAHDVTVTAGRLRAAIERAWAAERTARAVA